MQGSCCPAVQRVRVGVIVVLLAGLFAWLWQAYSQAEPAPQGKFAKAHEMIVSGGQEFHAGSQASLSCSVHGVVSLHMVKCHVHWVDWGDPRTLSEMMVDSVIRGITV